MIENTILNVQNIHLSYKFLKTQGLKSTLLNRKRREIIEFEALKGVSFSLNHGVNLGIIGSNGSGKSTLLRILANTLTPDKGKIVSNAKSTSLISLGVGFKPDLTGHENIYLNGLLLGLSKEELDKRMGDIIEFSELGDFISNPIKTYSSGMKSKLAFSIAINVDPDLLLIDEVFSVGDEKFREKSKKKMESMIKDDRTVVMVSHSMPMIKQYCQEVIWIEGGKMMAQGSPKEIVEMYLDFTKK